MSATCKFLTNDLTNYSKEVTRVAEVTIDGYVSLACHNQVTAALEDGIALYPGQMLMLERINKFCGLDPLAIIPNGLFNLRNHSEFERVAVVGNDTLLMTLASALAPLVSTQVKTFSPSKIADARAFLRGGLDHPPHTDKKTA